MQLDDNLGAPMILGLYRFAGVTCMLAAQMTHWVWERTTPMYLFPCGAIAGALAQFFAGLASRFDLEKSTQCGYLIGLRDGAGRVRRPSDD
jgi:hypothetical protein